MKLLLAFVICLFAVTIGEERIAGGENVFINAYPFATALLTNGGEGAFQQACGGTILTSSAILSAASCFFTGVTANPVSWWQARVGSAFASSGGSLHFINRITTHEGFTTTERNNDLAVLRATVPFTLQVGIVQAANIAGGAFTLTTNQPIWAIGWGATSAQNPRSEQLQAVQFWIVDQTTCTNRYNSIGFTVTPNMVCAGWLDVGVRGQCQGDSGSPLVESGVVVAVHSWTQGCADGFYPGVNTRVAPNARWIVSAAIAA